MILHYRTQDQSQTTTTELARKHQEHLEHLGPLLDQALWSQWMTWIEHRLHSCLERVRVFEIGLGKVLSAHQCLIFDVRCAPLLS